MNDQADPQETTRSQPTPDRQPEPTAQEQQASRPAATLRDGTLQASIWRNEGEKGPYYSTTYSRSYQDQDGTYRDTSNFVGADNLKIAELARQAYNQSNELRRASFKQQRETGNREKPPRQRPR